MSARRSVFADAADETWGSKRRGDQETELDITPMIDVTFLLLIFFMVTSTMQGTPDLDVPPAKHGKGIDQSSARKIVISAPETGEAGEPTIQLGGEPGSLEDVQRYVEQGVQSGVTRVIIQADRTVRHGFVQEVTKKVDSVEGAQFFIGVRDPQNYE